MARENRLRDAKETLAEARRLLEESKRSKEMGVVVPNTTFPIANSVGSSNSTNKLVLLWVENYL